ncbi:hypothetical protein GCM10028864_43030 [Microlunatus parietis]
MVGMAWVALVPRVPRPGKLNRLSADIQSVFVRPEHRGQGIGSALVEAATAHALRLGALHVTVHSGRRAVPVYERLGFVSSPELAEFVGDHFPEVRFAADVAGGQGMLARILSKRHNINCEVIDPRGWVLKGVAHRALPYTADLADYYDLIIGLHPDQALRPVVESAAAVPVLVLPCCNFWSPGTKLGRDALLAAISEHHRATGGTAEPVTLGFEGPMNRGLVLRPPSR